MAASNTLRLPSYQLQESHSCKVWRNGVDRYLTIPYPSLSLDYSMVQQQLVFELLHHTALGICRSDLVHHIMMILQGNVNVQECCHVHSQFRHRTPKPWKVCKSELTSFHVNMTWCIFLGAILTNKPILKEFKICWQRSFQKWCGSGSLMSNLTQATGHELKSRPWANFNLRHASIALDLVKHLWLCNSKLPMVA